MKDSNDNEISTLLIPLDFKKKPKSKPNTDRSYTLASNLIKKDVSDYNSANPSLLEKKKQYSMAIR
jgi:hypothetical protein